jgi:hypothetical protein
MKLVISTTEQGYTWLDRRVNEDISESDGDTGEGDLRNAQAICAQTESESCGTLHCIGL